MNKEHLRKWIEALRSGDYSQTKHCLRDREGHCCLGVLCEVYGKEKDDVLIEWKASPGYSKVGLKDLFINKVMSRNTCLPPEEVLRWLFDNDETTYYTVYAHGTNVAHLNDLKGLTFNEIADLLEKDFLREEAS